MTYSTVPLLRRVQLVMTCCSIAANALCGGGIFIFSLFSPALASHLKLTQPQLTTIVLAGMVGQYLFSPLVGKIFDRYGPRVCSCVSFILFSLGFGLFSHEIARTPEDITQPAATSFRLLVAFFFMAGLGSAFSYFSAIFAASKNFPDYPGVASGASMALFGLSPLFLSLIASKGFTSPETGLDVTRFLKFLATFVGSIHLIGAFNLRTPALAIDLPVQSRLDVEEAAEVNECSQLLPGKLAEGKATTTEQGSTVELLRDPCFWALVTILIITLGSCEMVISNIGTIVLSLPPSLPLSDGAPSIDIATSTQVRIFSLSNTFSRLLVGPLADFISPVGPRLPTGDALWERPVSRVSFFSAATLLLCFVFLWMDVGIRSQEAVWVLSIGTGVVYGATFTVLPSILSSIWGSPNLGRNFGIISYAPVVGTPMFSYLYAFISANHAQDEGVCKGVSCWQLTFLLSSGAALLAFCSSLVLWKRWKGRT